VTASDNFTVSLVQYAPQWEDVKFNLARLNNMIQTLAGKTDLIVLPEMFSTGFSMNTDVICNADIVGETLQWMKRQAATSEAMLAGGIAVEENGHFRNRFYWISPNGNVGHYDKRYLFSMSDEPKHFTAGSEQQQFEWRGWKIKPILCYDLRFPEWCRNSRSNPYDILICAASWPSARSDAWLTLLKARALENQCYVTGVNHVGVDGNGLQHTGDSIIYTPRGEIAVQIPANEETTATFALSYSKMKDFRKKFPALEDIL
jgi:predicted amidohydrolase